MLKIKCLLAKVTEHACGCYTSKLNLNTLWLNAPHVHWLHLSCEISVLSILQPVRFISRNSREVKCVCVFSLWWTRANNLRPTNQCPHSGYAPFAKIAHSSDHTTVCNHHTLCSHTHAHKHTYIHRSSAPPAATVYPLSPDERLSAAFHSVLLQGGKERECVCVFVLTFLLVFFLQHTTVLVMHNELLRHTVTRSDKSVWKTYLKSLRATFVHPASQLNRSSFVKSKSQFVCRLHY